MLADDADFTNPPIGRTRAAGWSWWPWLLSSLVHVGAFVAFFQFGGPGSGEGLGLGRNDSHQLIGQFLEGTVEEIGGSAGEGEPEIQLAASISSFDVEPEEAPDQPAEPEESVPEREREMEVETAPPEPIRPRPSRTFRTPDSIAETELEPPPLEESSDLTVIEEPAPRPRRTSRQSENSGGGGRGSAKRTGVGPAAGGRGSGGDGAGDGVGFFGLEARARTIVYVIDSSSSMESHSAMARAIAELEASLDSLPPTAKYGIVFFNNVPNVLPASGSPQPFANTPRNRRIAQQFISGVVPDAGSDRLAGLMAALALKPDAIFLLTDAGDPPLAAADIEAFRRRNRGKAPVHVVEFGVGVQLVRENFLTRLARQTAGGYRYVDVAAE